MRKANEETNALREEIAVQAAQINALTNELEKLGAQTNVPPMWEGFDFYEASVTLIVKDILQPGDTFYDVGTNLGGISLAGSRSVGPYGKVVAFEASPRIIPTMLANFRAWHASNVHLIPNAVWNTSGEKIELFFGDADVADSVVRHEDQAKPDHIVETVALDDVVDTFGVVPKLVKFDIEGAEQEALKGFRRTLDEHGPSCILEMDSSDVSLTQWMLDAGYSLFSCDNYLPFQPTPEKSSLVNVLCISGRNRELLSKYEALQHENTAHFYADDWADDGESPYIVMPNVEPGRYIFEFDTTPEALGDTEIVDMLLVANDPWRLLSLHISAMQHLAQSYTRQPLHLHQKQTVILRLKRRNLEQAKTIMPEGRLIKVSNPDPANNPWASRRLRF
jgi:FkbM family methyltransferase